VARSLHHQRFVYCISLAVGVWFFCAGKDEAILSAAFAFSASKMVFIPTFTTVYWNVVVPRFNRRRKTSAQGTAAQMANETDSNEQDNLLEASQRLG
jgi:hypothetical protein